MNRNQKKSSKISGFFNKLFASRKPKSPSRISARSVAGKRAVFFVFLAVLVIGFSFAVFQPKTVFAAKTGLETPPKPGQPLPDAWQQAVTKYEPSGMATASTTTLDDSLKSKNTVPTSAYDYKRFLETYGGYTPSESNAAGIANVGQLNTPSIISGNDKSLLSSWNQGQAAPEPGIIRSVLNESGMGYAQLGNAAVNGAYTAVLTVVIGVLSILAYFCKFLVFYAAQTLDLTLNPNLYNFTSNNMIVQGWTMVRDVCNLFFLLVLLFIAICTILKIEKYHAKKTLLMLIIMALLINFSKPIAIFIFDGSQLLMNEFLKQMGTTGTGGPTSIITNSSNIANLVYDRLSPNNGAPEIAIQYLFGVVFLFMLAVAYLVTALMLIIRIVVIMMLIIVSPFAFFAAIVPDFSKMSSQWWSSLFEYSYYGPAAAFFLLLATRLQNALPDIKQQTGGQTLDAAVTNIIHLATVLIFLYASIFMAKKFGGGAGAAVVGNANRVMKWGAGMTKGGGMWGSGARLAGKTPIVSDMYKGAKKGISQQPGWRMLTKEGREASSKERQEKWEGKVAPFSMATARKKAKEEEFKDQAKVDAGIARGNAHDLLIGSKRGTLTPEQLEKNSKVLQLIKSSPELRKEVLGNLRDKGQSHTAAFLRSLTPEKDDIEKKKTLEDFGKEEIYNNKKLGDMDWDKVINFKHNGVQPFEQILVNRLENIAKTNAQGFLNIASNLDGTKQDILRDKPKFQAVLKNAQENARGNRGGGQNNQQNQNPAQPPPNVPWS